MRIISFESGECQESEKLAAAFSIENLRNPVISFVGAGGKTTLITSLAEEYRKSGRKVFVTTTTHMLEPKGMTLVTRYAPKKTQNLLNQNKIVWAARLDDNGKIKVPTDRLLQSLYTYRVPILAEADGSKRLPCKAPAEYEPVILDRTDIVIGVLGMDAIGQPISTACHRPEQVMKLLDQHSEYKLTWQDLVVLALSKDGLRKNVTNCMRYIVFINKMNESRQKRTAALMAKALADAGQKEVFFGVMNGHENTD